MADWVGHVITYGCAVLALVALVLAVGAYRGYAVSLEVAVMLLCLVVLLRALPLGGR